MFWRKKCKKDTVCAYEYDGRLFKTEIDRSMAIAHAEKMKMQDHLEKLLDKYWRDITAQGGSHVTPRYAARMIMSQWNHISYSMSKYQKCLSETKEKE